jgi:lipopolysaccharide/colanic/teichoic acid biosynthesis glycosyltransferase
MAVPASSAARSVPPDPRPPLARRLKRAFDVAAASALLVLSAPILGLACLAVRLETPGSPVYRQRRVGKGGVQFDLLKLRTMVSGAERMGAGLAVDEGDPRITRVGALVRRLSIDELPNLVNVLRGEMSLVGPRPTVQVQVSQYTERQLGRLSVPPGITGWAQVKGRAALPWHERIELDLWYIEHWSLWLDLRILVSTAILLATGRGLYRGATGGWRPAEADESHSQSRSDPEGGA